MQQELNLILMEIQLMILSSFGIGYEDVESIKCTPTTNGVADSYTLLLRNTTFTCPHCGSKHIEVHGYYNRKINHKVLSDRNATLIYKVRRFKCNKCNKTFNEANPFAYNNSQISLKTIEEILKKLRYTHATFKMVAQQFGLSVTTIENIFDRHVQIPKQPLPAYLCIDENYAFHNKDINSKYICVLLDFESQNVTEILPARTQKVLKEHFESFSEEERSKVKVVCSDMYDAYRNVPLHYFPNAIHVVDRFHVMQDFNRRLNQVRINVMNTFATGSIEYYLLKKFHFLLFKEDEELMDILHRGKYNNRLKETLNYYHILQMMLNIDENLKDAYRMRESLYMFYEHPSKDLKKDLEQLILDMHHCKAPEISEFAKTLSKWFSSIINSFQSLRGRRISNGLIENRNKLIKDLKYNANGYVNFDRFRRRILYTLNSTINYSLIADREIVKYQRVRNKENLARHKTGKSKKYTPRNKKV